MTRIMIVEDDRGLREGIALALKREEFSFVLCDSLKEAQRAFSEERRLIDLVLLDINLPDGSGYELLAHIRQHSNIPVVILTANDLELEEVRGLELGAADYITKPFSLMVLRARIDKALRAAGREKGKVWQFGELSFSFEEMRFFRDKEEIPLSRTEQKLLRILVENRNQILTREQLVDRIWTDGAAYVDENALSVTVGRLRSKLGETGEGHLRTVYGKGYVWKV